MFGIPIGAAARRSGCPVATIRYYEEIGLMRAPSRSAAGRRLYGVADIERLKLIRRLRSMELGIEAVRAFVAALDAAVPSCLSVRDLAQVHLDAVRTRRAELDALERTLSGLVSSCTDVCASGPVPSCTIIDDLARA